jgi:hypothetical protein
MEEKERDRGTDDQLLDLVRPGLGHVDQGEDLDHVDDRGSELRRMIASTAASPERKRALRDLATWDRQSRLLECLEVTPSLIHACESAGVSKRTVNDWRQRDTMGFLARMDGARESFADRLLALSWSLVQRLRPGQSPVLLLSLLNHYVPGFRPATAPEPMDARTTLAELRALSASTAAGPALPASTAVDPVAEVEAWLRSSADRPGGRPPGAGPSTGPGTNPDDIEGPGGTT